jgi:hypothetical protein
MEILKQKGGASGAPPLFRFNKKFHFLLEVDHFCFFFIDVCVVWGARHIGSWREIFVD